MLLAWPFFPYDVHVVFQFQYLFCLIVVFSVSVVLFSSLFVFTFVNDDSFSLAENNKPIAFVGFHRGIV